MPTAKSTGGVRQPSLANIQVAARGIIIRVSERQHVAHSGIAVRHFGRVQRQARTKCRVRLREAEAFESLVEEDLWISEQR